MKDHHNELSQAERRAVLKSDRDARDTYFSRAQIEVGLELGGRFAALAKPTVGGPKYPQQPPTAPGNQAALVGDEPPLGIDVNAVEPVGTEAEIERSLIDPLKEVRRV